MFLLWCVLGGLLLHFFESLLLDILVKPNYEKPVDTMQDIVDRRLTNVWPPFRTLSSVDYYRKNSSSEVERAYAELIIIAEVIFYCIEKYPF